MTKFRTALIALTVLASALSSDWAFGGGLPLQPEEKIKVPAVLGSARFNVDRRYLAWGQGNCDKDLCDFWALLPDLDPITARNVDDFDYSGPDSRKVLIFLLAAQNYRFDRLEDRFTYYVEQTLIEPKGVPGPFGLHQHRPLANWLQKKDIFVGKGTDSRLYMVECDAEGIFPSPVCEMRKPIGEGVVLRYVFMRYHLKRWRDLDSRIGQLINSFRE